MNTFGRVMICAAFIFAAALPALAGDDNALSKADNAFGAGDWTNAAYYYEKALPDNPENPYLQYNLGVSYYRQCAMEEYEALDACVKLASGHIEKYLEQDPAPDNSDEARQLIADMKAEVVEQEKQYEQGVKDIREITGGCDMSRVAASRNNMFNSDDIFRWQEIKYKLGLIKDGAGAKVFQTLGVCNNRPDTIYYKILSVDGAYLSLNIDVKTRNAYYDQPQDCFYTCESTNNTWYDNPSATNGSHASPEFNSEDACEQYSRYQQQQYNKYCYCYLTDESCRLSPRTESLTSVSYEFSVLRPPAEQQTENTPVAVGEPLDVSSQNSRGWKPLYDTLSGIFRSNGIDATLDKKNFH